MNFVGSATPIAPEDIDTEAQRLGCDPAAIWAVCDVESSGSGFLKDGRPKILFEAHIFHTLTYGKFDRVNPNISSPIWDRSLYGFAGAHQYERLAAASELDPTAALESASWGKFQVMGMNYEFCGYSNVESFVSGMVANETNHLRAFGDFCTSVGITRYLVAHDWTRFALHYNGPGNTADYAGKLANAYNSRLAALPVSSPTPVSVPLKRGDTGPAVAAVQRSLIMLGFQLVADGIFGLLTEQAVRGFQIRAGLISDGIVDLKTSYALTMSVMPS